MKCVLGEPYLSIHAQKCTNVFADSSEVEVDCNKFLAKHILNF